MVLVFEEGKVPGLVDDDDDRSSVVEVVVVVVVVVFFLPPSSFFLLVLLQLLLDFIVTIGVVCFNYSLRSINIGSPRLEGRRGFVAHSEPRPSTRETSKLHNP